MWGAKLLPDGFVYVIRRFCKTKNQEIYQNLTLFLSIHKMKIIMLIPL